MDITMPSLGADMDEGKIVEWLVKEGDEIHKGDIIAVIETDKMAIDMEAYEEGIVEKLLVEPDVMVPVGTVLASLIQEPLLKKERLEKGELQTPTISSVGGQHRASPAVRRAAKEQAIDLSSIEGSGPEGVILLRDLAGVLLPDKAQPASIAPATISASDTESRKSSRPFDVGLMRKAVAAAMSKSKREIPHYYLSLDIDISNAQAHVQQLNAEREPEQRILLLALLLRATANSLVKFPQLNGSYEMETFTPHKEINIGNAISLRQGGLVVPAIHSVDKKTLDETMAALKDVIDRSRNGHLRSSELADATITITNIGDRGSDAVFGVIYPPQVAIIGFGRARQIPAVVDNQVVIRTAMTTTLSADHRVSDGNIGAGFLATLAKHLQQPEQL